MDDFMTTYPLSKDHQAPLPVAAAYVVPAASNSNPYNAHGHHAQWQQHAPPSDYSYAIQHPQSAYPYPAPNATNDQTIYGQRQPSPIHDPNMMRNTPSYYATNTSPVAAPVTVYQQTRPASVLHEGFSRARSTSYSGPYSGPYSLPPGLQTPGFSQTQYTPCVRMPVDGAEPSPSSPMTQPSTNGLSKMQQSYYSFTSPNATAGGAPASFYPIEDSLTPLPNGFTTSSGYSSSIPQPQPLQTSQQTRPSSIVPITLSSTNNNGIPRSMSMGSIPVPGTNSFNGSTTPFSGRTTPSGVLTPGSTFTLANAHGGPGSGYARSARLAVPSLTIPSNLSLSNNNMYRDSTTDEPCFYNSTCVSPTTPVVLSSLGSLRGSASGPGTASNGGSVPLTPTTDDTVSWDCYTQITAGLSRLGTNMSSADLGVDGGGGGDEEDEDNEEEIPMLSIPSRRMRGGGVSTASNNGGSNSPRRAIGVAGGVTRTEKKRRSVTLAAGPSAAVSGVTRSRSGTMVGASSSLAPLTSITASTSNPNPSLTLSPVDLHHTPNGINVDGGRRDSVGNGGSTASSSSAAVAVAAAGVGNTLGGQTNSPLAMKELSSSIKPMIEDHLLRYLNHLCMNPGAKDRMGHQIHQMYTARRIQRYEQLYGWRPLKFRIEAFVNGFVDLLTARGLSQDITMKIPHYLNNSKLFSRFNESGNRMKSQGQTIWRVRARCRTDIPGVDGPATVAAATAAAAAAAAAQNSHASSSSFPPHQQQQQDESGLMFCPDPLLWEFLPYERCIVGQPPLAIVGTAWQWNMKVHDHWTPRKKVSWSLISTGSSTPRSTTTDGDSSSSPSASSSTSSTSLPKWLSLHGSKLKGTPTQPGEYPISVEATFQEDNDPEPVVVRGHFKIQVSKAIGGWKNQASVTNEGFADSSTEAMDEMNGGGTAPGELSGGPNNNGAHPGLGGGGAGDSMGGDIPLLYSERMDYSMYTPNMQGEPLRPQFSRAYSYPFAFAH